MKKVLATILALVMALSVTTMAWADDVAKIGNTGYATLKEAIEHVANGETIVLTANVNNGDGIVVASGKNFTLDFAGHTYTITQNVVGSTGTESQCFQLLKDSTITMKDGAIVANCAGAKMIIQNYCNLTLDNMKLDATVGTNNVEYVVSNNCGNVVIKNGTTITAKTTGVAFDVYGGFGDYGDVSVTLEAGATVNGKVEVARSSGNQNKNTLTVTGGTVNGDLAVTPSEKTEVAVTGGTFSSDVSAYAPEGTPVAIVGSEGYAVGSAVIAAAANSGKSVTVTKAGPITGVDAGKSILVARDVTGVTINGNTVTAGTSYTVPSRYYYYQPTTDTKTTDTKGSPKTFDAGIALYVGMALTSAAGVAFVGKKRED